MFTSNKVKQKQMTMCFEQVSHNPHHVYTTSHRGNDFIEEVDRRASRKTIPGHEQAVVSFLLQTSKQKLHHHQQARKKKSSMQQRKKQVRFSRSPDVVRRVCHIKDYTCEEIQACWYSDSEQDRMYSERRFVRFLIESGLLEKDDDQFCRRGIETSQETTDRENHQGDVIDAVLHEQDMQWDEGITDARSLARVYKSACRSTCYTSAQTQALKDHLEVLCDDVMQLQKMTISTY